MKRQQNPKKSGRGKAEDDEPQESNSDSKSQDQHPSRTTKQTVKGPKSAREVRVSLAKIGVVPSKSEGKGRDAEHSDTTLADVESLAEDNAPPDTDESITMDEDGMLRVKDTETGKRGRPVTTGEWEKKKAMIARRETRKEEQRVKDLNDPSVPAELSGNRKRIQSKRLDELRLAPTRDLSSRIMEAVRQVDKVNSTSKTLRGADQRCLNDAAATIAAAITHLITRGEEEERHTRDAELEELRTQVAALRSDNAKLNERLEALLRAREDTPMEVEETGGAPLPPSPPSRNGGRKTRGSRPTKKYVLDSSDDEEEDDAEEKMAREASEVKRLQILADIDKHGMPPVVRPAIQGSRRILEEATLPKGAGANPPTDLELVSARIDKMEGMLATLLSRMGAGLEANPTRSVGGEAANKAPLPNQRETGPKKSGGSKPGQPATARGKPQPKPSYAAVASSFGTGPGSRGRASGKKNVGVTKADMSVPDPPASSGRATGPGPEGWQLVTGRKGAKGKRAAAGGGKASGGAPPLPKGKSAAVKSASAKSAAQPRAAAAPKPVKAAKRRLPNSAAVTITSAEGAYEELLREARAKINPAEMGFTTGFRPKRAQTGALVIEIPGRGNTQKADELAEKLWQLFANRPGVRVSRPSKMGELRVLDLEDSVTGGDIAGAVARVGGCLPGQVQVGQLRRGPNGLNTAWVRCPLAAVIAVCRAGTRIQIGWFLARVQALEARPLQCFRCLEGGHVRAQCTSPIDRSARCYRCGEENHLARDCGEAPKCPVCADLGRPSGHRAGGKTCASANRKARPRLATGAARAEPSRRNGVEAMEVEETPSRPLPRITCIEETSISLSSGRQASKRSAPRADKNATDRAAAAEISGKPKAQRKKRGNGLDPATRGERNDLVTQQAQVQAIAPPQEQGNNKEETELLASSEDAPPLAPSPSNKGEKKEEAFASDEEL